MRSFSIGNTERSGEDRAITVKTTGSPGKGVFQKPCSDSHTPDSAGCLPQKIAGQLGSGDYFLGFFPISRSRQRPTPVIIVIRPKTMPPSRAACASFSPKLVPTKAIVNPNRKTHIPSNPHFQKCIGIPRSSIQILNPTTIKQTKIPCINKNNPLMKKEIFCLQYNTKKS